MSTSGFHFTPGWLDVPHRHVLAARFPQLLSAAPALMGQANRTKPILLYMAWKDTGGYPPYRPQEIGDCVSHASAHGNDLLQAVQLALGSITWQPRTTCTEYVYGASRKVAGMLGGGDGSYGSAAAEAMTKGGMIARADLPHGEEYYDGHRAKAWGTTGPPPEYEVLAFNYKLGNAAQVRSWDELCDALANGFPVIECSMFLPSGKRDQDGFCGPQGSGGHAQLLCGVRFDREGACLFNSWPHSFYSGPLVMNQPEGSYWVDRKPHVDRMLATGDCWAFSAA